MSSLILKGIDVTAKLKEKTASELSQLKGKPNLAIIRIGEDPSLVSYEVAAQKRMANLGIDCKTYTFSDSISQEELDKNFEAINTDSKVHSILLLKPIPAHLSDRKINETIHPMKDVDCIGISNMADLYQDDYSTFGPCTAEACLEILDFTGFEYKGKRVAMVGFGMVIGKPLTLFLVNRGCTVTICHEFTKDLIKETKDADVIVTATGVIGLINEKHVNPGTIIIDVGINLNDEGKIVGDADYPNLLGKVKAITPVPGGVGGVTNAVLASHIVRSYKAFEKE